MSINVTVSGNPVSIKRGKMVTFDPNNAKKEFDKRRLLRLEQVRQQSNELAEDVRSKVRREKKKQMGEIEREGKEKLKSWQNRKLLELQSQYRDALDDIGHGHKEAEKLENETEILEEEKARNEARAKNRARVAATKLQVQRNENNYKKAMPMQNRKIVRDIENTRAALVSCMKNKKDKQGHKKVKKRKTSAAINITIPEESSADSSELTDSNAPEEASERSSEDYCDCSESSEEKTSSETRVGPPETSRNGSSGQRSQHSSVSIGNAQAQNRPLSPKDGPGQRSLRHTVEQRRKLIENFRNAPPDTRISDRIRRRELTATRPDFCDLVPDPTPVAEAAENTRIRDKIASRDIQAEGVEKVRSKDPLALSSDECVCSKVYKRCGCKEASEIDANGPGNTSRNVEIPSKPPVRLKEVDRSSKPSTVATTSSGAYKVRHYDHANRFRRELPSSTAHVERIASDSVEVIPDLASEAEWLEKMRRRDAEAQVRGKRASEKEKVQRDYEEIMKKLPMLQRREHIAQIGADKPQYHMSEDRLKELERKRQNRLENAVDRILPDLKPQIVTVPISGRRDVPKPDDVGPFRILDGDDSRTLDLGKWDADAEPRKMFSAEEVQEIVKAFTVRDPEDRKVKLKRLLRSLKVQKEQLLDEIRLLPRDDSVDALIGDLRSFGGDGGSARRGKEEKAERKRRREESDGSNVSSGSAAAPKKDKTKQGRSPSKRSRPSRSKVLVLQSTSTQTTPKVSGGKGTLSADRVCAKTHVPCDCDKANAVGASEELCRILIELRDDDGTPKVEVVRRSGDKEEEGKTIGRPGPKPPAAPAKETIGEDALQKQDAADKEKKKVETKSVATETETFKKEPRPKLRGPPEKPKLPATGRSKGESWKEQLSKNSVSTSSTSYLSPPDLSRPNTTTSSLYNLRKKPRQTNWEGSAAKTSTLGEDKRIDPKLLLYIRRLLGMSKTSVEDLAVSSVSEVQTPSQSVIEIDSNNPLAPLHDIIRYINAKAADWSASGTPEASQVPPNSCRTSDGGGASPPRRTQQEDEPPAEIPPEGRKDTLLAQYADVTDSCSRRIANLAAMIEKLREEKVQMLQSPPLVQEVTTPTGDKEDHSTRYLDLPPSGEKSNSTASMDEEELNRRLLEVDMSLAEKLKRFRRAGEEEAPRPEDQPDRAHREFQDRLQRLIAESRRSDGTCGPAKNEGASFVPLLVGIPKLPILEPPEPPTGKRHPPPSKGLKKFNGDVALVPHELSTIVEAADSQMSTRISPNGSKTCAASPGIEILVTPATPAVPSPSPRPPTPPPSAESKGKSLDPQTDSSKSLTCTEATCTSLTSAAGSGAKSSSSGSDMASIELMLKSIGMEWAIPTLHKTQEALALSSSSSSGELGSNKRKTGEVGLKDFLQKQMLSKISSSSYKSDASPASFMQDASELSAIPGGNCSCEMGGNQRTSTPVTSSKSSGKSKEGKQVVFAGGASDISSVKNSSEKASYYALTGEQSSVSKSS